MHKLLIVAALIAVVYPALAQPTLGVTSTNNQVILFWSANTPGTNSILQSTTELTPPNWVSATDAVVVAYGSQTAVSVANSTSSRFFRLALVPPTTDGMTLIPAGSFTMGDTLDGETDAVPMNIYVSAFYMDTNLVSYSLWQTVYSYATNVGYGFDDAGSDKATNHPVWMVNWYDCVKWCNARSQQAGLNPVYYTDAGLTQVYVNGDTDAVYPNWTANGYRLPTEAEWEKAARGGLGGQRFPWGDTVSESQANYYADPPSNSYDLGPYSGYNTNFDTGDTPYTSPVGYFDPNSYGLYDMAGNEFEWCWDWYGIPYGQPTTNNPTGPASGSQRVIRGGSWSRRAEYARCANRLKNNPNYSAGHYGFRCVRGILTDQYTQWSELAVDVPQIMPSSPIFTNGSAQVTFSATAIGGDPFNDLKGTGFGSRIARIQVLAGVGDGKWYLPSFTPTKVLDLISQFRPSHLNRFTGGPVDPNYVVGDGMTAIQFMNAAIARCANPNSDHCISARLDWIRYSDNGSNVTAFINAAGTLFTNVYSQLSPPQRAIGIDEAHGGIPTNTLDIVSKALLAQGWKYIGWGANANTQVPFGDADWAMLSLNPTNFSLTTPSIPSTLDSIGGYVSYQEEMDWPNNWNIMISNYPTADDQTAIFTTIAQQQKYPFIWVVAQEDTEAYYDSTAITNSSGKTIFQVYLDLLNEYHVGTNYLWNWDFGDGSSSTNQNPTHIYYGNAATNYLVVVTITDQDGNTATNQLIATISAAH
jgi:formylglycine-generating enzyme required for sulfatase activity